MRRGTTPTLPFVIETDLTGLTPFLSFKQSGKKVLVKTGEDLDITYGENETRITCKLTQQETLALKSGEVVEVQVRAADQTGEEAVATTVAKLSVDRILQEGVIHG